jgi:hypothetical protein
MNMKKMMGMMKITIILPGIFVLFVTHVLVSFAECRTLKIVLLVGELTNEKIITC